MATVLGGVWAGNTGRVIELARLAGPQSGWVDTPPHLLPIPPFGTRIDLADPAVKARLYTACLRTGSPYDAYRYVNLNDLAVLLTTLDLPPALTRLWTHALRDAGLLPDRAVPMPSRARRARTTPAGPVRRRPRVGHPRLEPGGRS